MARQTVSYRIFGCTVASNLSFPGFPEDSACAPDYRFLVSQSRPAVLRWQLDPSAYWLQSGNLSEFEILPDNSLICYPAATASSDDIRSAFLNEAFPLCLSLTRVVLHASAILTRSGAAVAFIGTAGTGKSTLACEFARHGSPLLADDCLPVIRVGGAIRCQPGLPMSKLEADSLEWAGIAEQHTAGIPRDSKRQVGFGPPSAARHLLLARIYRLVPGPAASEVRIREVDWNAALRDLMDCTYRFGEPSPSQLAEDFTRLSDVAASGLLRRLCYPCAYPALPSVREAVISDVSALPSAAEGCE